MINPIFLMKSSKKYNLELNKFEKKYERTIYRHGTTIINNPARLIVFINTLLFISIFLTRHILEKVSFLSSPHPYWVIPNFLSIVKI